VTKTILRLNQIDESKKEEIVGLLNDKYLGIKLTREPDCMQMYYGAFKELRKSCQSQLTLNSEYIWNKTIENYDFYLNLKDPSVYSWTMPKDFQPTPHLITRTSLKAAMDAVSVQYERTQLYLSNESAIIKLQSAIRGYLVRRSIYARLQHFEQNIDQIIKIQVGI
jgi:hypothetical protein